MKQQYLSSTLRNRSKLPSGKVFWFSMMYRHKNWKKDNEFRNCSQFNCPEYVMCVCISDKAVSSDFSQ